MPADRSVIRAAVFETDCKRLETSQTAVANERRRCRLPNASVVGDEKCPKNVTPLTVVRFRGPVDLSSQERQIGDTIQGGKPSLSLFYCRRRRLKTIHIILSYLSLTDF